MDKKYRIVRCLAAVPEFIQENASRDLQPLGPGCCVYGYGKAGHGAAAP